MLAPHAEMSGFCNAYRKQQVNRQNEYGANFPHDANITLFKLRKLQYLKRFESTQGGFQCFLYLNEGPAEFLTSY